MKRILICALIGLSLVGCTHSNPQETTAVPEVKQTSPTPAALQVTEAAPSLVVKDQDGKTVDLPALYQQGPLLVFFYPKAGTPGCTAQACSLRDSYQDLSDKGLKIIGVSLDNPEAQKAFKEKQKLPYQLIPDTEKTLTEAFGVSHFGGMATRQAFLIRDGKISWHDASASTSQQAADVLREMESWSE